MNQEVLYELILTLLYLVPISFFRFAPFISKFRFSTKVTVLLYFIFFTILNCILLFFGLYDSLPSGNRARTILYSFMILFSFVLIKDSIRKQLFVICFYANFSFLFTSACLVIEHITLGSICTNMSFKVVCTIALMIPAIPLIYQFSYKLLSSILIRSDNHLYNTLWFIGLIQLFLCCVLSVQFHDYDTIDESKALIRLILSSSSILINHTIVILIRNLLNANDAKNEAESGKQQLLIQQYQYRNIQEKIEESRRFRHDFKHHSSLIASIVNDNFLTDHEKLEKLTSYCNEYFSTVPSSEEVRFCEHYSVNLILNYYYEKAEEQGIRFDIKIKIPSQLAIKDTDLSIIIGNLCLNAIEGAATAPDELKQISLTIAKEENHLLILMENGFDGLVNKSDDTFYSTKHPGSGIGIINIQSIIKRYHGTSYFENKEMLFSVRIHLVLDY